MEKKVIFFFVSFFVIVSIILGALLLKNGYFDRMEKVVPKQNEPETNDKSGVTLTYAVHWTEAFQTDGTYKDGILVEKGLKQYLEEYSVLHPEVKFEIMTVPYVEYEAKMKLLDDAGAAPDIFQIYSPWGVSYVEKGMIDAVPQDIKEDIEANYVSKAGVTINGDIRGIPGEVNDFALIYNKKIFKEAGIVDENGEAKAPKTWTDLVEAAKKTALLDDNGNLIRYGFAFTKGMDWAVVDPFLSLLFTNGGRYLSEDGKSAAFNTAAGREVLSAIVDLFNQKYTDINSNVWDFTSGKVSMAFVAPWAEGILRNEMGERFDEEVGVAPIPYFKNMGSLQYSWFIGVMNASKEKEAAWDFLRWFTKDVQDDRGTTRYGDLMARTIKAIPSRQVDLIGNADVLENNFFKAPFIYQLPTSTPEPNILQAAAAKEILREEIEAAWSGKSVNQALNDAENRINALLQE